MSRLAERFSDLRKRSEGALVPFVTAGDPDLETTEALVHALAEAGADAIELGVPFSDPMADGPTIQRASERALAAGATLRRILELVKKVRTSLDLPIILMGYANPFLAMGERGFVEAAAGVGVDGLIVVDLPPEEGVALFDLARGKGIDPILLAAPTTPQKRLEMLVRETRGFLYYISLTGVTSARAEVAADAEAGVRRVKALGDIPVCVGFGVSTPAHSREIGAYADGVVVGSAIVDRIEQAPSREAAVDAVAQFVSELKAPLRELS